MSDQRELPRPCELCSGDLSSGVTVAMRAAGTPAHKVACRRCGLVTQISPLSDEVDLLSGSFERATRRAVLIGRLLRPTVDERVLLIGRDSVTLAEQLSASTPCRIEAYESLPSRLDGSFDHIAVFDALECTQNLMGLLRRVHGLLVDGGCFLVEVRNLTQPRGTLEQDFFRADCRFTFSPWTLSKAVTRGGFVVESMFAGALLALLARKRETVDDDARQSGVRSWGEGGALLAERLDNYRHLESLRASVESFPWNNQAVTTLANVLRRRGLDHHVAYTVRSVVRALRAAGRITALIVVLEAVIEGPHRQALHTECRSLLEKYRPEPVYVRPDCETHPALAGEIR